ncbi:MAG: hypothetical protein ACK55Z_25345, partial [bacterium]
PLSTRYSQWGNRRETRNWSSVFIAVLLGTSSTRYVDDIEKKRIFGISNLPVCRTLSTSRTGLPYLLLQLAPQMWNPALFHTI